MSSCGKRTYPTPLSADLALEAIVRRDKPRGREVPCRKYPCGRCRGFRLTSRR